MSDSDTQSLNLNRKSENDQVLEQEEDAVAKALEETDSQEEVETKTETPKQEETPAETTEGVETPEVDETPETDSQSESEDQEHSQLSERGQNRIKDLADQAAKVPDLERKLEVLQNIVKRTRSTLPSWMTEETQKQQPKSGGTNLPWDKPSTPATQTENEDGTIEVTQEELIAQAEEAGRKAAREESIDQRIDEVLQEDAIEAEENYPVFKKSLADGSDNPQYNEELTNLVFGIYKNERQAGNKTVRLKDIVSKVMTVREQAAEEGRKQSAEKLARAAAEQAIDPSGTPASTGNENLEDKIKGAKSMKDLEALGKLIPSEK